MLLFPMDPVCGDTLKKYNHNMGNRRLNRSNQYPAAQFASSCFLYQRLCQLQYQFNVKLVAFVTIYMEEQVPTCLPVCKTQIEYLVNVIINVLPSYSRCCCFHCNFFCVCYQCQRVEIKKLLVLSFMKSCIFDGILGSSEN